MPVPTERDDHVVFFLREIYVVRKRETVGVAKFTEEAVLLSCFIVSMLLEILVEPVDDLTDMEAVRISTLTHCDP